MGSSVADLYDSADQTIEHELASKREQAIAALAKTALEENGDEIVFSLACILLHPTTLASKLAV